MTTKTPTTTTATTPALPSAEFTTTKPAAKVRAARKPRATAAPAADVILANPPIEAKPKRSTKKREVKLDLDDSGTPVERSEAQMRLALKRTVRIFYDLQEMRLQVQGRLRPDPKKENPIHLHPHDIQMLNKRCDALKEQEKEALKDVQHHLRQIPFYVEVLSDKELFKGVGPTMAGVILAEFDIRREENVSQMYSFAGLAPVKAYRCKKCNAIVQATDDGSQATHPAGNDYNPCPLNTSKTKTTIIDGRDVYASGKSMRPVKGEKLPYNAFLRSKLVGVLGPVLLQVNSPWRYFYDSYKHRLQQPQGSTGRPWGTGDAHRHMAAIRYMVKMLLLEIYIQWRSHLGLHVRKSYQEEYLGHTHVPTPREILRAQYKPMVDPNVSDEIAAEAELADL